MIMKKEEMKITELYDLTHTLASDYLKQFTYPWEALAGLSDFIIELGNSLDPAEYEKRGENIWVHKTAKVFDSAYLHGTGHRRQRRRGAPLCIRPWQRPDRRKCGSRKLH